jgi:rhodanese-related sulfurtransferase
MSSKRAASVLLRTAAARAPTSTSLAISGSPFIASSKLCIRSSTRFLSNSSRLRKENPQPAAEIAPSILYNFADIQEFTASPNPNRIIVDVREPSELLETGTIPNSKNLPVSTAPDAFFISPEEFEDKFGWERPGKDTEVVFFCKAGVRSKTAAKLAQQAAFGGKTGEYPGSWLDWVKSGGKVQKA